LSQFGCVDVTHGDEAVIMDKPGGELVQEIFTTIRYFLVNFSGVSTLTVYVKLLERRS